VRPAAEPPCLVERSVGGVDVLLPAHMLSAGFAGGFAGRFGGVSAGPYASLNVSPAVGDDEAAVAENRARAARALGLAPGSLVTRTQVHGARVGVFGGFGEERPECDALISTRPGLGVGVVVADCVPLLLADPESGLCAAVHVGWRGLVAGVIEAAVGRLAALGAESVGLLAAVGPAIGPCCCEVGPEVAGALGRAYPGECGAWLSGGGPRPRLNLPRASEVILVRLGVDPANIVSAGLCTRCHTDRFFSYRAAGGVTGRMLAAIAREGTA